MKTKMNFILLPVVFVIVSMFISCISVGIAEEKEEPPIYIKSQEIMINNVSVFAELDPITQCWEKFTDRKGNELKSISREEFFGIVSEGVKVKHIVGSSCDSFIVEVYGNTTWCCGRRCYRCG